jgi:hypothetical protein
MTALIYAANKGHIKIVELLLNAGADVNSQTDIGSTALIGAASDGHIETVQLLINAGANPDLYDIYGDTAALSLYLRILYN